MTKVAIRIEAMSPEAAPINGDTGGSLRSIASSCPASPPIKEATSACQSSSWRGINCSKVDPNTTQRTSKAMATATNAATIASQTWFANTLANTRPATAPLKAPTSTIMRTLAETETSIRGYSISWSGLSAICKSRNSKFFPSDDRNKAGLPQRRASSAAFKGRVAKALISISCTQNSSIQTR